jgi:hypothetical protein
MSDDSASRHTRDERSIPPRDIDPADRFGGVDDHAITPHPRGIGHQPSDGLDKGVDAEHLASESQGVKVERVPSTGQGVNRSAEDSASVRSR